MALLFYYFGKAIRLKPYQCLPIGETQWSWFAKTDILKYEFKGMESINSPQQIVFDFCEIDFV